MIGVESNAFSRQFSSGLNLVNAELVNGELLPSDSLNFGQPISLEAVLSAITFSSVLWVAIGFIAKYWLV